LAGILTKSIIRRISGGIKMPLHAARLEEIGGMRDFRAVLRTDPL